MLPNEYISKCRVCEARDYVRSCIRGFIADKYIGTPTTHVITRGGLK